MTNTEIMARKMRLGFKPKHLNAMNIWNENDYEEVFRVSTKRKHYCFVIVNLDNMSIEITNINLSRQELMKARPEINSAVMRATRYAR